MTEVIHPQNLNSEPELMKKGFKWHQDVVSGLKALAKRSSSLPCSNFMKMQIDSKKEEIILNGKVSYIEPYELAERILINGNENPCHVLYAYPALQTSQESELFLIYICPEICAVQQKMLYSLNLVNLTKIINSYPGTKIFKRIEVESAQELTCDFLEDAAGRS